jgi:hypothetical protein
VQCGNNYKAREVKDKGAVKTVLILCEFASKLLKLTSYKEGISVFVDKNRADANTKFRRDKETDLPARRNPERTVFHTV